MIPGNILVVDNEYKDVEEVISSFEKNGFPVIYMASAPEEEKCPVNIRLIILDLDLDGCGSVTEEDISQAVLVLKRVESRTKFYMVALWSKYIDENEEWSEIIRNKYKEETGNEFPAYFLKPFRKKIEHKKLLQEIEKWVGETPLAGTVFKLESIVEDAMDGAVSDISNAGGIAAILKSISEELGKTGTPRELSILFNRILTRHSSVEGRVRNLAPLIDKVLRKPLLDTQQSILDWYAKFHNLQAYFNVEQNESLWTGDIIMKKNSNNEFAIVLNPACDFAQNRVRMIKIAYAIGFSSVQEYNQDDLVVPPVIEWIGKKKGKYRNRSEVVKNIIDGGLPINFYVLYFLEPTPPYDSYFHILIDLSKVQSLKAELDSQGGVKIPREWKRICRLDNPYILDLLQKYATFTSRVGTPDLPEDIKKEEIKRIKSTN